MKMKEFKKFYVWALNAKFFMAIYFLAIVFVIGVIGALCGKDSIELMTLLEVLLISAIIGFGQAILLPDTTDYSRGILFFRSAVWILASAAITVLGAALFSWFSGLPDWCIIALGGVMLIGCAAMLLGKQFEQNADTVKLNSGLNAYKK